MNDNILLLVCSILEECEGFSATAYPDPATKAEPFTIGYGETHPNGIACTLDMTCTKEDAQQWVKNDLIKIWDQLQDLVQVDLTDGQWAAILDFCYNLGVHAFEGSTLLKLINQNDMDGASVQFIRWNTANHKVMTGLTRRRNAETKLWNS